VDGSKKVIPNPAKSLTTKDGTPIPYALHLRDLTGQIVATLTDNPKYRPKTVYGEVLILVERARELVLNPLQ